MALGSKKRDYKTEHKSIARNLKRHSARMKELMDEGMNPHAASRQAFEEITGYKSSWKV